MNEAKPKRWKKRLLRFGFACFVLLVIAYFVVPPFVNPWLHERVEEEIASALDADGHIDSLSFSIFGGVEIGTGEFVRDDASLSLAWSHIDCDLSPLSMLLASDTLPLGDRLTIEGLEVEVREPARSASVDRSGATEQAQGTATTEGTESRLALPAVSVRNATLSWSDGDQSLRLDSLDFESTAAVVATNSKQSAGTGLSSSVTISVSTPFVAKSGSDSAGGEFDARFDLTPRDMGLAYASRIGMRIATVDRNGTTEESVQIRDANFELLAQHDALSEAQLRKPNDVSGLFLASTVDGHIGRVQVGADVVASAAPIRGDFGEGRWKFTLGPTKLNDGILEGTATLEDRDWSAEFTARDVVTAGKLIDVLARVSPIFAYMKKAPAQVTCTVGVPSCTLRGSLDDPERTLNGEGELSVSTGRILLPEELQPLFGALQQEDLEKLEFRPYQQRFKIEDGRIENTGFGLASSAGSLWIEGHTTVSGALHHTVRLDKIAARDLGVGVSDQMLLGMLKNNPIRLAGTVDEPRLILPPVLERLGGLFNGILGGEKSKGSDRGSDKGSDLEDLIKTGLDLLKKR